MAINEGYTIRITGEDFLLKFTRGYNRAGKLTWLCEKNGQTSFSATQGYVNKTVFAFAVAGATIAGYKQLLFIKCPQEISGEEIMEGI